jgi:TRAP-type C4-dicarboxylate transport system permease small subunit
MPFVRIVAGLSELLRRVARGFCLLAMSVIVCDVLLAILARAVLKQPPVWTEELARYLFVWVTFLGATAIYPTGENIVVDLFLRMLSGRGLRGLSVFAHGIVGVTAFFMVSQGIAIVERTMGQRSSVMQIPFGLIYSVIPLSGAILLVHTARGSITAWLSSGSTPEGAQGGD